MQTSIAKTPSIKDYTKQALQSLIWDKLGIKGSITAKSLKTSLWEMCVSNNLIPCFVYPETGNPVSLVQQFQKAVALMLDSTVITLTGEAKQSAQEAIGAWESRHQICLSDNPEWTITSMNSDGTLSLQCDDIDYAMSEIDPNEIAELVSVFNHSEFEGDLNAGNFSQNSYVYDIDQTGNSPENYLLTIYLDKEGGDIETQYNYDSEEEAKEDMLAALHIYGIEFSDINAHEETCGWDADKVKTEISESLGIDLTDDQAVFIVQQISEWGFVDGEEVSAAEIQDIFLDCYPQAK